MEVKRFNKSDRQGVLAPLKIDTVGLLLVKHVLQILLMSQDIFENKIIFAQYFQFS